MSSEAREEIASISEMFDAGQGDDDGPQIMPDFEPGMSLIAKVEDCLHLLEKRRDVIMAYEGVNWRDDPSSDERWNAGLDYAMTQLCALLGVDTNSVRWDAATETLDGDVRAVLGGIMRAKYGEDWGAEAAEFALSKRDAPQAQAVVALPWQPNSPRNEASLWALVEPINRSYSVEPESNVFRADTSLFPSREYGNDDMGLFPTQADAKAACQADFERRILFALTRPSTTEAKPVEALVEHKWLDPECGANGCQSLIWKGRYESATKGRGDFRQAFRREKGISADHVRSDLLNEYARPSTTEAKPSLKSVEWAQKDITKKLETRSMTDAQIKHMVEQFLRWKLPEDFAPDCGISFKREYNENTSFPMKHEPTGTNLFDYNQATAMVRHMLEGLPEHDKENG